MSSVKRPNRASSKDISIMTTVLIHVEPKPWMKKRLTQWHVTFMHTASNWPSMTRSHPLLAFRTRRRCVCTRLGLDRSVMRTYVHFTRFWVPTHTSRSSRFGVDLLTFHTARGTNGTCPCPKWSYLWDLWEPRHKSIVHSGYTIIHAHQFGWQIYCR